MVLQPPEHHRFHHAAAPRGRRRRGLAALLVGIALGGTAGCVGGLDRHAIPPADRIEGAAHGSQAARLPAAVGGNAAPRSVATGDAPAPDARSVQPVDFQQRLVMEAEPLEGMFGPSDPAKGTQVIPPGEAARQDAGPAESDPARLPSVSASDQPPASDSAGRSPETLISLALAGHPKLQAARQRVAAEMQRIPQARALPDPRFSNTFWPLHDQALQTAAGRIGNQMSLTQAVPWPKKLSTQAAIASREVQIAQAEVDRLEREITEQVKLAYYELWYTTEGIAIVEETRGLVSDLTRVAEARYRSGGTQQDVLRAQLEADRLDDRRVALVRQKRAAQADLAALLQQPVTSLPEPQQALELAAVPEMLDRLITRAEECNPELRGLGWEVARDRERQRLAYLQQYPDLQFGVNWALVSDDHDVISPVANGHDNFSFTVGTSLPVWRKKIDAGIREAAHRTGSSQQRLAAERDALYGQIRRLLADAEGLVEQRAIFEERMIPRAEDTLQLAIADYRGKRTDFFALIETYRELLMFELQAARIKASLAGKLAELERAVGCPDGSL
jgi:outer membrane protein TolC